MLIHLILPVALAGAKPISPPYEGNCQSPTWAPDGTKLAYEVNYHDKKTVDLYVYEPGKGDPRKVQPLQGRSSDLTSGFSTGGGETVTHEASWGPAKLGRFVYSASSADKDYDLYLDGGGVLNKAPGADGGPDWSSDGRWVVFTSARTGQGDLYLLDLQNSDLPPARLTNDATSAELYAAFSPDGKRLVYVGHTDNGDNLYLIDNLNDPKPRRLTSLSGTSTRPSWSPDGSRIAFYSNKDDNKRFDLYVMGLDSTPFPVARGVVLSAGGPAWTPDGKHLVYVQDDDDRYDPIYKVPVASPDQRKQIRTNTVGNGDLHVVQGTDGMPWLAVAAQGLSTDKVRDFKRIYVMRLD